MTTASCNTIRTKIVRLSSRLKLWEPNVGVPRAVIPNLACTSVLIFPTKTHADSKLIVLEWKFDLNDSWIQESHERERTRSVTIQLYFDRPASSLNLTHR